MKLNYIMQRGDRFYFRIRIPVSLRPLFDDRKEIRRPLGTGNPRLAMRLSQHFYLVCTDGFEQMKDTMTGFRQIVFTNPDGSKVEINQDSADTELEQALALQKQAIELQLQQNKKTPTGAKTSTPSAPRLLLDQLVESYISYKTKDNAWSPNTQSVNQGMLKGLVAKLGNPRGCK